MQPQMLDLISNKVSILKRLTEPLIRKGGQTRLVPLEGNRKYTLLPMPLADLYTYLLERKLVTLEFYRPREGPQCLDSIHPRNMNTILGLKGIPMDNKLIQFDNVTTPKRHHKSFTSLSGRECECHHHSGRKGYGILLTIIPVEGYAPSLSPREPP